MRKIQTLFTGISLVAVIAVTGTFILTRHQTPNKPAAETYTFPTTKYGAFLAAQHAIYVNDFESAARFAGQLTETEYATVQNTKFISEFLNGHLPINAKVLANEKTATAQLIYDAYLVTDDGWKDLYNRHKRDESALSAPLRIWSAVAISHPKDADAFIEKLQTNSSWKAFIRGQIAAEQGNTDAAAKSFADVAPTFMNINDYQYIMSFYRHNKMDDAANALRTAFTSTPGGVFMAEFDNTPDWSHYAGYKNQMAFSLLQNVSHTQIMMYSDLAVMLLRFAQIIAPEFGHDNDAINYYLGQFLFTNDGNYKKYFDKINSESPFKLFAAARIAEDTGDISALSAAMAAHPLFVPGMNILIGRHIRDGQMRAALGVINDALNMPELDDKLHAFFLKNRAQIYYAFGDLTHAQADIRAASDVLDVDADIVGIQAKIWAAQGREIENAYEYAMTLVRRNPTDVMAWDTLGVVVAAREGVDAGIELLARVADASRTCSVLFADLGDMYAAVGDDKLARDAYLRAIDLADDGLVVVPELEKKIRALK